ncbi:MAG: xanthine dehydrogenase family protein molybdopterin-binding subunit [Deltaproteobacteria bacterium]|nr:xanthine dehydrogenase family protein molybdopterin-binding subunit [Deltaproteobacteria bacterium]
MTKINEEIFGSIGRDIPRIGADAKLKGSAIFSNDVALKNALLLKVLRSELPHALIETIECQDALNTPGCVAVFTARDIPGRNRFGIINKDQALLADKKVRFIGDPVALVAANSEDSARTALSRIRVTYRELAPVFDPEVALAPGAPLIHEKGNLLGTRLIKKGVPDAAFEKADVVIERLYQTSFAEHAYLEPDAGAAFVDEDGCVVIYATTQNPHYDQADVARLLGLPENKIRIIQTATGGGFGSKLDLNTQGFLGLAAYLLNRSVRMTFSREEAFLSTPKRHPLKIRYKSAADKDGRLLAVDVKIIGDTGAYASYGMAVVTRSAAHATGPYEVPNVHIESIFAYTNNPIAGAMRGFGVPQIAFAHESQMDLLAEALGISPLEIRRKNLLRLGSTTATRQELTASVGIGECLEAVAPHYERIKKNAPLLDKRVLRGVGLGCMMYGIGNTGVQNPSTAQVELQSNGQVTLFSGAADIGQGSSTVLIQIAATELGLDPDQVNLVNADTGLTTSAGATSASRQTYISGNAVLDATKKLKETLLTQAATMLKTSRGVLSLRKGKIVDSSNTERFVSMEQVAKRSEREGIPLKWQGFFDPETTPLDQATGEGKPYATFAFATQLAEVEIDILTGEVTVVKIVAAHDVGRAINPDCVRGQIYGGVAMGLGFALMEEFIPGKTISLKDYHVPTCSDMPVVEAIIIEDPEPTGPFGAKGVGEPALIPTAPAIVNAIADALGVRIYFLPANLERVMKAIHSGAIKIRVNPIQ